MPRSNVLGVLILFFACVVGTLLVSQPRETYANAIWTVSNNYGAYHQPAIGGGLCLGVFLVLLFGGLTAMSGGGREPSSGSLQRTIEAIVEHKLTNEEIESSTEDVRRPEVRARIVANRSRAGGKISEADRRMNFNPSRFDQYAPPEEREQTNSGTPSIDSYMDAMRRMFRGASIRFTSNIFSGKDIEFSMRGRKQMEMSNNGRGKYRIVLTMGKYGDHRTWEVYEGDARGATEAVQKWYKGGIFQTGYKTIRNISSKEED